MAAIVKTELASDRVGVHLLCKRPWGTPDDCRVVEVEYGRLYALPPSVPLQPECYPESDCWEECVLLPDQHVRLTFRFARWRELSDCAMEVLVGGPYQGPL